MSRPSSLAGSFAGRRGDRASRTSGAPHALLDSFTHTPSFAGWVGGKLRSDYTGHILRIRRAADDAEINIDAVTATGKVNTAAIATHCAGDTGYLVTLYDQSGNAKDITQATKTKQPIIYQSDALVTGGKGYLAALFDGTDDFLGRADSLGLSGDIALTMVADVNQASAVYDTVLALGNTVASGANNLCVSLQSGVDGYLEADSGEEYAYNDLTVPASSWYQLSRGVGDATPAIVGRINGVVEAFTLFSDPCEAVLSINGAAARAFNWGANPQPVNPLHGRSSFAVVWSAALSTAEQDALDAFLVDRHA